MEEAPDDLQPVSTPAPTAPPDDLEPITGQGPSPKDDLAQQARETIHQYTNGEIDIDHNHLVELHRLAANGTGPWDRLGGAIAGIFSKKTLTAIGDAAKSGVTGAGKVLEELGPLNVTPDGVSLKDNTQGVKDVAAGATSGGFKLIPFAYDLATGVSNLVAPDSAPELNANSDEVTRFANQAVKGSDAIIGGDPESSVYHAGELIPQAFLPLGIESKAAKTTAKIADAVVEGAPKVAGKVISGASKAGKVVGPAAAAAGEAATGHPYAAIATLVAGYGGPDLPIIGRLKAAIVDRSFDKVHDLGKALANTRDGETMIGGLQEDALGKVSKINQQIDDIVATNPEKTADAFKTAKDGTPLYDAEDLSGPAKKIRELQDLSKNYTQRASALEKYKNLNRILSDGAKFAGRTSLNLGVGGATGAALIGPTGEEGEEQDTARAGFGIGTAFGALGAYEASRQGKLGANRDALIAKGKKIINPDQVSGLSQEAQDYIHAHAGLVSSLGGKVELLSPEEMLSKSSSMPPKEGATSPNGAYDSDTNTLYINKDALNSGVMGHEFTHLAQQQVANSFSGLNNDILSRINSPDVQKSEAYKKFAEQYTDRMRKSIPNFEGLTPEQINSEVQAEIGRQIFHNMPPEAFYGGKSGSKIIGDWLSKKFGKKGDTSFSTIPGFDAPYTKDDLNNLRDVFYQIGERAKTGAKDTNSTFGGPGAPLGPDSGGPAVPTPGEPSGGPGEPAVTPKPPKKNLSEVGPAEPTPEVAKGMENHEDVMTNEERAAVHKAIEDGKITDEASFQKWIDDRVTPRAGVLRAVKTVQDSQKPFKVTFLKSDGSLRTMNAQFGLPEGVAAPRGGRKTTAGNPNLYTVYDHDAKGWRTFPADSVQSIEGPDVNYKKPQFMPHITPDEVSGTNSRPVSPEEFARIEKLGRAKLAEYKANSSPTVGLDKNWDSLKDKAWNEVQKTWGGLAIDAHTGETKIGPIGDGKEVGKGPFSVSAKEPGQSTLEIPINSTRAEFDAAMDRARQEFPQLANQNHHLGVFRDESKGTIDFDPSVIIPDKNDAEAVSAHTRNIGGAYDFDSGNGLYPPHVPKTQFMPSDHPEALDEPAARMPDGRVFRASDVAGGMFHGDAHDAASEAGYTREQRSLATNGFVTKTDRFLDNNQARQHAKDINQISNGSPSARSTGLESMEFDRDRKFMPADDQRTAEALSSDKAPYVGAHRSLAPGTPIGVRIDIPAYERTGTYVQTIHEKAQGKSVGKRIGYDSEVTVDNPTFMSNERGAQKIRDGANKFPVATVEGEYNPTPPASTEGWTEVGYNPRRHSYFYDKSTGRPVESGEQAYSKGNTVYVKNPVFGEPENHAFMPSAHPEAIDDTAIKTPDGKVHTGRWAAEKLSGEAQGSAGLGAIHPEIGLILDKAYSPEDMAKSVDGYVTRTGQFLNRQDANKHAQAIRQLADNSYAATRPGLDSVEFDGDRRFMPSSHPDAVDKAAVRFPDGKIYTGWMHPDAWAKGVNDYSAAQLGKWIAEHGDDYVESGYLDKKGNWLSRKEAEDRGKAIGQFDDKGLDKAKEYYGNFKGGNGLEALNFDMARKFMPSDHPDAIRSPAVRTLEGDIFEGAFHGSAATSAFDHYLDSGRDPAGADEWSRSHTHGWTTNSGEFLDREQADKRAAEIGQMSRSTPGSLESIDFNRNRKFMPHSDAIEQATKGIENKSDSEFVTNALSSWMDNHDAYKQAKISLDKTRAEWQKQLREVQPFNRLDWEQRGSSDKPMSPEVRAAYARLDESRAAYDRDMQAIQNGLEPVKGVYVRFGEPPEDGISQRHYSKDYKEPEDGLSVYPVTWDPEGQHWNIVDHHGNAGATLYGLANDKNRKILLMRGDEKNIGGDGEPVIRNAKVIKSLNPEDILPDEWNKQDWLEHSKGWEHKFMPAPNEQGFYSHLESTAEDLPDFKDIHSPEVKGRVIPGREIRDSNGKLIKSIPERREADKPASVNTQADQILKHLKDQGVKDEELAWTGTDDFLADKKAKGEPVTKEELLKHIRDNAVEVNEVTRGGVGNIEDLIKEIDKQTNLSSYEIGDLQDRVERGQLTSEDEEMFHDLGLEGDLEAAQNKGTKYDAHVLPGAEPGSYRELLLTKPRKDSGSKTPFLDRYKAVRRGEDVPQDFKSTHYDEPNVLAHVRFNDRKGPNGEKILHLEEMQSDWHQLGRKHGYAGESKFEAVKTDKGWQIRNQDGEIEDGTFDHEHNAISAAAQQQKDHGRVPDAPFKTTQAWSGLAMKRMIRHAAENGYDAITWTTGDQQAARYDLSKQIRDVVAVKTPGGNNVWIHPNGGSEIGLSLENGRVISSTESGMRGKGLDEIIGKDLADKIFNQSEDRRDYTGLDLKVGGEGMKGFYDKILPSVANELGKKFGARVGETEFSDGTSTTHGGGVWTENTQKVHSLPITPEMKESVMTKGQPLFMPSTDLTRKIKASEASSRKSNPEAYPLTYQKDKEGNYKLDEKGNPKPNLVPYDLYDTPVAKSATRGIKDPEKRQEAAAGALADKMVEDFKSIQHRPEVMAGKGWYQVARTKLNNLFGGDMNDVFLFSRFLAATSARTGVLDNFKQAVDAYNQLKSGAFGDAGQKYIELRDKLRAGELKDEKGNTIKPGGFKEYLDRNGILPRKSNGTKYNANSEQVLKVLAGVWDDEAAQKTVNFKGNLTGETLRATIDVWASRNVHRISGAKRILPKQETAIPPEDFQLAQRTFDIAADKLQMNPDDLQAIMWFAEKSHWDKNGWTGSEGKKLSDFRPLIDFTKKEGSGLKMQDLPDAYLSQKELKDRAERAKLGDL